MSYIGKVWIAPMGDRTSLSSISLQSANAEEPHERLRCHELLHPKDPTPEHPLRHVLNIGSLTPDDLWEIYHAIGEHLEKTRYWE